MSFYYISIFLSVLIGILIITRLRSYDIYEKEAFTSMFMAFILGGGVSVIIALVFYGVLRLFGINDAAVGTVAGSFLIIGPVEEFAKLTGLIFIFRLLRKQINEVTDGVIYMSCVALGFSIIENFFYANSGNSQEHLLIFRAIICTPAHISFSCLTGYAFYRYKNEKKSLSVVFYAFLLASILHGIYDALAFIPYVRLLLLIYLFIIIQQSFRIVQYTNVVSPFRPTFINLFTSGESTMSDEAECPYCKSGGSKRKFVNDYFTAYKCESCGYHFTTVKSVEKIFRNFAPEYKNFRKKIYPVVLSNNKKYHSVYGAAFFEHESLNGFFNINDLSDRLNLINQSIIDIFRKTSIIPKGILARIID